MQRCLIIFAKEPQPGQVKTRLAVSTGAAAAARLCEGFIADTLCLASQALPGVSVLIACSPSVDYFVQLAPQARCILQQGDSFEQRLLYAFETAQAQGADQIVLIGTDSPSMPAAYLQWAFALLDSPTATLVLGPCEDGGWYLVGLHGPEPQLFTDITWSTGMVAQETRQRARALGLQVSELPTWYDIDTVADLQRLEIDLANKPADEHLPHTLGVLEELRSGPASQTA